MQFPLNPKPFRRLSFLRRLLPLVVLVPALAGCSSPGVQTSKSDTPSAAASKEIAAAAAGAEAATTPSAGPNVEWSPDQSAPLKINDFVAALNKSQLKVTRKHQMFFELVKASDGSRLTIDHKDIEVYEVDASTEKGRKTLAVWREQGIFGYPTKVRKNLALGNFEDHPKSKEIVAVFEAL